MLQKSSICFCSPGPLTDGVKAKFTDSDAALFHRIVGFFNNFGFFLFIMKYYVEAKINNETLPEQQNQLDTWSAYVF